MSDIVIEKKLKWKDESSEESEPSEVFSFDPKAAESCICSDDLSVLERSMDTGAIDTAFPENPNSDLIEKFCLPPSYYTLSGKERLILLFAENFRRQFAITYPNKRPLALAIKNECGVQKFVCNSIRPTGFLFPKLIGSLEEISSFVADFISYESLENPISLPPRLYSPDLLLRLRRGNSYEMATLLVSMLIGAGFPAMVVSGTARHEVTLNDQREVICPYIPEEKSGAVDKNARAATANKYVLREPPDLTSHLDRELADIQERRNREAKRLKEEEERRLAEAMEEQSDDRYFRRRSHAWVAIIENAPWSVKPRTKTADDAIQDDADQLKVFFIEPTTGFRQEVTCKSYIRVESMWNNFNYYVNRQDVPIKLMRWDVTDVSDWEHFLAGEPPELQVIEVTSEVNLAEASQDVMLCKHLDMIISWVQKLHIGNQEYEERYPNQKKTVHYKQAIHERFSPYSQKDGKEMQLSLFLDDIYHKPARRWQFFRNRLDLLDYIHINYIEKKVEESFKKGRPDKLMFYEHNVDPKKPKLLHFYSGSRLDALKLLEIHKNKIVFHYGARYDMCYYQEFRVNAKTLALEQITEKFVRNTKLSPNKDIAVRHFYLTQNKIFLQFHYAEGAVTASTREFIKPPKPDYGQEIIFNPNSTKGYNANPYEERVSDVQIYFLLLDQLKTEERLKKEYDRRMDEIDKILESRKAEMKTPKLMFSLFDPLRNEAARKIRMMEFEEAETRKQLVLSKEPDFLAPYLVLYEGREPNNTESWNAYNTCLQDLKSRYIGLLSELQRRYEDLTSEAKALKKFLDKFHDQFDNFDYERLLKEKKEIELNKRMVQQRLKLTHEQAQKKYETIKESLINDARLHLL